MCRLIDFPKWLTEQVGKGPFKCRCGSVIEHPGVCDSCDHRAASAELANKIAQATGTIPPRFRACVYGSEELHERCAARAITNSRVIITELSAGKCDCAVLVGPKGVGKTSLACAMLRELFDKQSRIAWKAFYVRAIDLGVCRTDAQRGSTPRTMEDAMRASVLLLDDLGQESDTWPLREVIHARHDDVKPMIVTTAYDKTTIEERYGGGMDRRLFERAAVLRMGTP